MGLVGGCGDNRWDDAVESQNPQNRGLFKGLMNKRYPQVFLSVYKKLGSLIGYRLPY